MVNGLGNHSTNCHENCYIYVFFNGEDLYAIYVAVTPHYMSLEKINFSTFHPIAINIYVYVCIFSLIHCIVGPIAIKIAVVVEFSTPSLAVVGNLCRSRGMVLLSILTKARHGRRP